MTDKIGFIHDEIKRKMLENFERFIVAERKHLAEHPEHVEDYSFSEAQEIFLTEYTWT